jgi:hypothetical protein
MHVAISNQEPEGDDEPADGDGDGDGEGDGSPALPADPESKAVLAAFEKAMS